MILFMKYLTNVSPVKKLSQSTRAGSLKTLLKKLKVKSIYHKKSTYKTEKSNPYYQEFVRLRREVKKDIRIAYKILLRF